MHLYEHYGQLTPQDLKNNNNDMNKPYNPNALIKNWFEQIEQAIDIAATARAPYNAMQIINVVYTIIFNTNTFSELCQEWLKLPQAKNMEQFQTALHRSAPRLHGNTDTK